MRFKYNRNIFLSALQKHCGIKNCVLEEQSDVVSALSMLLKSIDSKYIVIGTSFFGSYMGSCNVDGEDVIIELTKKDNTTDDCYIAEVKKFQELIEGDT